MAARVSDTLARTLRRRWRRHGTKLQEAMSPPYWGRVTVTTQLTKRGASASRRAQGRQKSPWKAPHHAQLAALGGSVTPRGRASHHAPHRHRLCKLAWHPRVACRPCASPCWWRARRRRRAEASQRTATATASTGTSTRAAAAAAATTACPPAAAAPPATPAGPRRPWPRHSLFRTRCVPPFDAMGVCAHPAHVIVCGGGCPRAYPPFVIIARARARLCCTRTLCRVCSG